MTIIFEERLSDSPYVETVTHGWTVSDGSSLRPAEVSWHMVFVSANGQMLPLVVGPWTTAGVARWGEGAEILWVRFRPGAFMPHLPTKNFRDSETALPCAASNAFWLKDSAWQFPDYENVETFIEWLAREEILVHDPVVDAALQDEQLDLSPRTVRHRFLQATGQSQNHIRQMARARQALTLLQQGASILDTVHEAGYFDQPHLTRSLKQFFGYTPAQVARTEAALVE